MTPDRCLFLSLLALISVIIILYVVRLYPTLVSLAPVSIIYNEYAIEKLNWKVTLNECVKKRVFDCVDGVSKRCKRV